MFGTALEPAPVRIRRRRWLPFQPRHVTMAPMGHLHFHPASDSYCDDFSAAGIELQGHFIHEMTHVWQTQTRGRWHLMLRRHPLCRYDYTLKPGWPLECYGLEQQAEIVRHAFLLSRGVPVAGAPSLSTYQQILPFRSGTGVDLPKSRS